MSELRVKDYISNSLGLNPGVIEAHHNAEDLGIDSLEIIEIIMDLEQYYMIELNDDLINKCRTVQDITILVENTINEDKEELIP